MPILPDDTLAIGHTKHLGEQRVSSYPFPNKKLRGSNRQDFVLIRPPGIARGEFELRMDNVWYCRLLLLFEIKSRTDDGIKRHKCAFVSVLEEFTGDKKPGIIFTYVIYQNIQHLCYIHLIHFVIHSLKLILSSSAGGVRINHCL